MTEVNMNAKYRFYYDGITAEVFDIDEVNAHKIRAVLRLAINEKIDILTKDKFLNCEIVFISKSRVAVHIIAERDLKKPTYELTAFQLIAKREYMDFIVEKYAEIGVTKIVPIISSRSFNNMKDNTLSRYRSIAINAVLQSEGEFVPKIEMPIDIKKIDLNEADKILFHERIGIKTLPINLNSSVGFIIGCEGGFTDDEYNILIDKGFIAYNLMDRVLKAETAATVFSAALMMRMNIHV